MTESRRYVRDDWRDYRSALTELGLEISDERGKVAHLLSWYRPNKLIAERLGLHLSKVKVIVHDLLVLLQVENRADAAMVIRHAVEAWRARRDRPASRGRGGRSAATRRSDGATEARREGGTTRDSSRP